MKSKIIYLLLPLFFWGCSKKPAEISGQPQRVQAQQNLSGRDLPLITAIVETAESREIGAITNQARDLFRVRDYDGLDVLARKLRDSKERYANGGWKFYYVYVGLNLPEGASEAEWDAHIAALQDWINARPDSITARVALANSLVDYAWKARGSDWAYKVKDEGWQLFYQRLNEAVEVLDKAKLLKEQCPYWWSVKFETELGLSPERSRYDASFEEATSVWPDYEPYYCHRAYYLLPRWYGTEGEWESDLEKSSDKIGGDQGDLLYARVAWSMQCDRIFTNIFTESKLSWPRVNKGFEVMEKQFPDSLAAKSEHANLAVFAGDAQTARKYFDQLGGKVDLSVWHSPEDFLRRAVWTYAHGK